MGSIPTPEMKIAVENAYLVISVDELLSDFNAGVISYQYSTRNDTEIYSDQTNIKRKEFPRVIIKKAFNKLIPKLGPEAKKISMIPPN